MYGLSFFLMINCEQSKHTQKSRVQFEGGGGGGGGEEVRRKEEKREAVRLHLWKNVEL